MPPASHSEHDALHPEALQDHLTALYRLAHMLTGDASQAAALVERTYRHVLDQPLEEQGRYQSRSALYHLMIELSAEEAAASSPGAGSLPGLHHHLARRHYTGALPTAFAGLPPAHQLLLYLCYGDHLSPGDIAQVVDRAPNEVSSQLEAAHSALRDLVFASAPPAAQHILPAHLSEENERSLLRRFFQDPSASPPSSLEQTVDRLLQKHRPLPTAPSSPEEPAPASSLQVDSERQYKTLRRYSKYALITVLVLFVVSLGGLLFQNRIGQEPEPTGTSLVELSTRQAFQLRPTLRTQDAAKAAGYVENELERTLSVPSFEDAALTGVAISEVADNVQVPVLFYKDARTDRPLVVYAYNYALLDRHADQIQLAPRVLQKIEQADQIAIQRADESTVGIWRRRADIFVAVAGQGNADLGERLLPPQEQ